MKRGLRERTRGSRRNVCIYSVIACRVSHYIKDLFKSGVRGAQRVRPPVRSAHRTTTLMMSLYALVKHAFILINEVNKKGRNNLQCPTMNSELIAQIIIII